MQIEQLRQAYVSEAQLHTFEIASESGCRDLTNNSIYAGNANKVYVQKPLSRHSIDSPYSPHICCIHATTST